MPVDKELLEILVCPSCHGALDYREQEERLVCTSCGRVRDLPMKFAGLQLPHRFRRGFTVEDVQVIFRGRCEQCSPSFATS